MANQLIIQQQVGGAEGSGVRVNVAMATPRATFTSIDSETNVNVVRQPSVMDAATETNQSTSRTTQQSLSSSHHSASTLIVLPASALQDPSTRSAVLNGVPLPLLRVARDSEETGCGGDSSNESGDSADHSNVGHSSGTGGLTAGDATTVVNQGVTGEVTQNPHFIAVAVSAEGDTVASHPGYHVQYVDSDIYASTQPNGTSNGQMAYPVYTVGESGTLYTGASGQYFSTNQATGAVNFAPTAHYLVQTTNGDELLTATAPRSSPIVTPPAETTTFINNAVTSNVTITTVPTEVNRTNNSEVVTHLGHITRISPATVQWLLENFENADGVSLPRSTLYAHYIRHCNENKLEPVNAASFGKLIRSVFTGLRTRRLGTRGNSKYHYYGIRLKPGSSLVSMSDEKGSTSFAGGQNNIANGNACNMSNHNCKNNGTSGSRIKREPDFGNENNQHFQFLGDGNGAIPEFPDIEFNESLPDDCSFEDVDTLRSIYREHCEAFLDAILGLEFSTVESLWREFWRAQDNNNDECEEEKYLSKSKLYALCALEPMQNFMKYVDLRFYQNLVQVLLPDVLRPIPSSLTQAIRNFAKGLESWLSSAMTGCPQNMISVKLFAVSAFSQSLRRYTSLNHLAQAARAVLHNSQQIAQMLADLNRVDFHNVQEQASWVCQCDYSIVQQIESDFKLTLQEQNSLEQWAVWLKNVVQSALKSYEGKPDYPKAARQFLLKWSFYSSMVIRDLTLRSAASFGSFHLIRLLYDEYMFYLIEHQVAQATGLTPIAVMAESNKYDGVLYNSVFLNDPLATLPSNDEKRNDNLKEVFCKSEIPSKKIRYS